MRRFGDVANDKDIKEVLEVLFDPNSGSADVVDSVISSFMPGYLRIPRFNELPKLVREGLVEAFRNAEFEDPYGDEEEEEIDNESDA